MAKPKHIHYPIVPLCDANLIWPDDGSFNCGLQKVCYTKSNSYICLFSSKKYQIIKGKR
jgi:hypothetical protein